jgi:hypothetical protein
VALLNVFVALLGGLGWEQVRDEEEQLHGEQSQKRGNAIRRIGPRACTSWESVAVSIST